MEKSDRVFTVDVNGKFVEGFTTYYENNDGKLSITYTEDSSKAMRMNWFDLQFFLSNYTHSDNWKTVVFGVYRWEV